MRRARERVRPGLFAIGLALLASVTCSGRAELEPRAPVAGSAPARRPPGVSVDPRLDLPKPASSAYAESGFAVLLSPVDPEPARRLVAAFFRAVAAESVSGLERLMEASAATVTSARRPEPGLASWQRRFARLDYTKGGLVPYVPSALELKTARDVEAANDASSLPLVPRGDEILVRAPVQAFAANRLFGPEVVFLLEPGPSGYKIKQLYEDFRLP